MSKQDKSRDIYEEHWSHDTVKLSDDVENYREYCPRCSRTTDHFIGYGCTVCFERNTEQRKLKHWAANN